MKSFRAGVCAGRAPAGTTRARPGEGQKRLLRGPGFRGGLTRGRVSSGSGELAKEFVLGEIGAAATGEARL